MERTRAGETVITERRMLRKDGSIVDTEISSRLMSDGSLLGIIRDISRRREAQRAFRRSLRTSTDIAEAIPSGLFIFRYEEPGRLLLSYANPEGRRLMGVNSGKIRGSDFDQIWPIEQRTVPTETFLEVLHTGRPYTDEDFRFHDGQRLRWFRVRAFRMPRNRLCVAFEDSTERKQAEYHVRRLLRLRKLLTDINQAIVHCDDRDELFSNICTICVESGKFEAAWIGLLDKSSQQIVPVASAGELEQFLDEIEVHADERPSGKGPTGTAVRTGELQILSDIRETSFNSPYRNHAAESGYISAASVPFGMDGRIIGALTVYSGKTLHVDEDEIRILRDLAEEISYALKVLAGEERCRAIEADLAAQRRRLDALLHGLPAVLWMFDEQGILVDAAGSGLSRLGLAPHEMVGRSVFDLFAYDQDAQREATAVLGGKTLHIVRRMNGGEVEIHLAPLMNDSGGIIGAFGVAFDVTEREVAAKKLH
jgi:PAS domain S-box-containing protein